MTPRSPTGRTASAPNAFLTDGAAGVPYEDMIELCNETEKDMWINIPALATPQFVQSLAQLISTELNPNLNVYVEYGNEDWNYNFFAYSQIATAALANPVLQSLAGPVPARGAAERLLAGDRRPDLRPGLRQRQLAGPADPGRAGRVGPFQTDGLQFIQQEFGPPSQYIYAMAVAPYLGPTGTITASTTLEHALRRHAELPSPRAYVAICHGQCRAGEAIRRAAGRPTKAGRASTCTRAAARSSIWNTRHRTTRECTSSMSSMIDDWEQAGGGLFNAFQLNGGGNGTATGGY